MGYTLYCFSAKMVLKFELHESSKGKREVGAYHGPLLKGTRVGIFWSSKPGFVRYFEPFLLSVSADVRRHSQVRGDSDGLDTRNQLFTHRKIAFLLSLGKIEFKDIYGESKHNCGSPWLPVPQPRARHHHWMEVQSVLPQAHLGSLEMREDGEVDAFAFL